jgi:uncharacterized protein YggE
MKRISVMAVLVLASAGMALAQNAPTYGIQVNTIYAGADGKFESAPDTAVLHMDIASQQETSKAAYDKVAAAADNVRTVLRNNGIEPKIAELSGYSVQPIYDWKNPKRKVVAYRVVTSVKLKIRDFEKIGPLTEQLAGVDDASNQSIEYTLEEIEQAKAKASADALKKARNQANAVAVAGGRSLGELLYASVDVNQQQIVPVMMKALGMARAGGAEVTPPATTDFTPQTVTINAHVNVLFALR